MRKWRRRRIIEGKAITLDDRQLSNKEGGVDIGRVPFCYFFSWKTRPFRPSTSTCIRSLRVYFRNKHHCLSSYCVPSKSEMGSLCQWITSQTRLHLVNQTREPLFPLPTGAVRARTQVNPCRTARNHHRTRISFFLRTESSINPAPRRHRLHSHFVQRMSATGIISKLPSAFEAALASENLICYPSTLQKHVENGIEVRSFRSSSPSNRARRLRAGFSSPDVTISG